MEQEYIKGDIVMYDSRIHTIMDTLGVNNYELSYISHPVHQLELSGVPITPEILDNNKWKRLKSKRYTWWKAIIADMEKQPFCKAIMDMFCAKITAEHPELPPLNIKETVEKLSSDEFIESKIKSVLE